MSRQARIEPVIEASDLKEIITGWLVIDETVPENEVVISEHPSKKEAIQAAEALEQQED